MPFILYGKDVLRGIALPKGAAGAHIDIGPTLVELAAPKGFAYYAMGQDLLAPQKQFLGIGWFRVVGKNFVLDVSGVSGPPKYYPLPDTALPKDLPDIAELKGVFDRTYGIGWWRVRRGEKL